MFLLRGNDYDTYYCQDNNPEEELLRKEEKGFLEFCGPTAATMLVFARIPAKEEKKYLPKCRGGYIQQPESILSSYFNDPRNYHKMYGIRPLDPAKWFGNRIPQWYEIAVMEVFGVKAKYVEYGTDTERNYTAIVENIKNNIGVMICLKSPGHYLSVVGATPDKKELIYNDPWLKDYWPTRLKGTSTFNRVMRFDEFRDNTKPFVVLIGE